MGVTGVNHITFAVSDLDRSLRFYCDVLGGRLRAQWPRGAYLQLGQVWLCLAQSDAPVAPRNNYTHLALSCSPDAYDRLVERLTAHAEPWQDNTSEGASYYFLDPVAHKLELHQGDLETRLAHYRSHPDMGVTVFD